MCAIGFSGRLAAAVAGLAVASVLVCLQLAGSGAVGAQVTAATIGAALLTGGAALAVWGWPRRRESEALRLALSAGFFLICAGIVAMLAGVGLYH